MRPTIVAGLLALAAAAGAVSPAQACGSLIVRPAGPSELREIARLALAQSAMAEVAVSLPPDPASPRVLPFRVIRRLKGRGPETFTLFGAADPRASMREIITSSRNRVLGGSVEEPVAPEGLAAIYCHGRGLRVAPGRTYIVLRDSEGRLLSTGMQVGVNIVPLSQHSASWLQAVADAARTERNARR